MDIQRFITENICDIPDKPDIEAMQQNIRDYKRHEQLAQRQEEKLEKLVEISRLYQEMLHNLQGEQDRKKAALADLRKNIKDYPRGLLQLRDRIAAKLKQDCGQSITIDILADVLEIPEAEEHWRNAVEGYLNTQKFYLLFGEIKIQY